jgi:hypothetical protein
MRARKAPKKTAFVPRVVFRAAFAGASVVPICVAAGCGNSSGSDGLSVAAGFVDGGLEGGDASATHDARAFDGPFVVAVATVGFGDASDGGSVVDGTVAPEASDLDARRLGVAMIGFSDGGDARDVAPPPGVAVKAFWMGD